MKSTYGVRFATYVREYLKANGMATLGRISADKLAELAQHFHDAEKPPQIAKERAVKLATEEEWIQSLEKDPALTGMDIRRELGKAIFWCNNNSRKCTRKFFANWLIKAQGAQGVYDGKSSRPPKEAPPKPVYSPEIPVPGWPLLLRREVDVPDEKVDQLCAGDWHELPLEIRNKIIQVA